MLAFPFTVPKLLYVPDLNQGNCVIIYLCVILWLLERFSHIFVNMRKTKWAHLEVTHRRSTARISSTLYPSRPNKELPFKVTEVESLKSGKQSRPPIRWYNCNENADHISRDYLKKQKPKWCSICCNEEHSCIKRPTTNNDAPTNVSNKKVISVGVISIPTGHNNDEKYFKNTYINGKIIENAIIDPGNKVCVIQSSIAIMYMWSGSK